MIMSKSLTVDSGGLLAAYQVLEQIFDANSESSVFLPLPCPTTLLAAVALILSKHICRL